MLALCSNPILCNKIVVGHRDDRGQGNKGSAPGDLEQVLPAAPGRCVPSLLTLV